MLVLSRKIGERIHIGQDIFVEVRRVGGNRVTLAVNAPRNIRILRGELFEAANEFDVLDEHTISESAKDTVIMKNDHTIDPQEQAGKTVAPDMKRICEKVQAE